MQGRHSRAPLPHPLLLSALLAAGCATANSEMAATPQRPTLSSNTATTAQGTLELEAGFAFDDDNAAFPVTAKYGSGPRTEVFAGSPAWQKVEATDASGPGDLTLGIRHRVRDEDDSAPAFALQSIVDLPLGDDDRGLGNGAVDAGFAAIVDRTFGDLSTTGYYAMDFLGEPDGGTDVSHSLALAGGVPLDGGLGAFAELAGIYVPEQDSDSAFTTLGLTFTPRPATVFDLAVVLGLDDDLPDWQLLFGVTWNLGGRAASTRKP